MAIDLKGRTALVTGAARRLGRHIALALAAQGVNVAAHYHSSAAEAESLLVELESAGVRAWALRADFEKPTEYKGLIDQALALCGSLDILVNSASIFPAGRLDETVFDDVVKNIRVNAWAPFELCRSFARACGKGAVVNVLDTRVRGFDFDHAAYILSKHMLDSLTAMAALEYAPGLRVNAVAPGLILPPPGKDDGHLEGMAASLPLKRRGHPHDVAEAVVFLLRSEFITGQVIYVDGGRHVREYGRG